VLVVGRGGGLLEGVPLADAAVYHTGKMHGHGEGRSHGSQQELRNKQDGRETAWGGDERMV
jgi:hypothetical protein